MTTYDEYSEFKISLWAGGQELLLPIKEDELVLMMLRPGSAWIPRLRLGFRELGPDIY